jgi:NADH:ubiquinone reductase (non-electrogenic)
VPRPKIIIVGGGFGGLFTALQLDQLPWQSPPEITLVNKGDRFLFTPLLYELVTNEMAVWEIAPYFSELLEGKGVRFQQGLVTGIDLKERTVQVETALAVAKLDYDVLVLALGNTVSPSPSDLTLSFRSLKDAQHLHQQLSQLEAEQREKIRVCVAGGGASGVELACKISDRLKERGRVRIIERNRTLLKNSPPANRRAGEQALRQRGVWLDLNTKVIGVEEGQILLDYGNSLESLPVDLVLWTAGSRPLSLVQDLIAQFKLSHTPSGSLAIAPTLQLLEYPQVFALGDTANFPDNSLPATAQVAYQQAGYCARNIWAYLNQAQLQPFVYVPLGEFLSLGVGQSSMSTPFLPFGMSGHLPNLVRRLVYLGRMPTLKHQWQVALHWLSGML